ncbi:MAG: hypothetical protein PHO27_12315 [Sulfuricurvum sp.]|nr:hypothetical protein [Sulfuricurvum sp.]
MLILEEIIKLYFHSAIIHAILITAAMSAIVFIGLLVIEKSFTKIACKLFQNLDYYAVKIVAVIWVLSYLMIITYFNEYVRDVHLFSMCIALMILLQRRKFHALDDEMQDAFNHEKNWWDILWGNTEKVQSKYLDIETYQKQGSKIMAEYISKGIKADEIKKIDGYVAQTCEIIENINEIFRKSLKNETTMVENRELLYKAYQELKERYEYFEKKYHDLLQDNYTFNNPIAELIAKNMEVESQKDLLNNL